MNWTEVVFAALGGAIGGALGGVLAKALTRGSGNKSVATGVAVVPALLCAFLGAQLARSDALKDKLGLTTRVERFGRKYIIQLEAMDGFKARVAGKSTSEVRAESSQLSHAGLKRLSIEDLDRWNALRLRLSEQSAALCAGFWTGNVDPNTVMKELDALSDEELDDWERISIAAMRLEVENGAYAGADADAMARGLRQVTSHMDPATAMRFQSALAAGEKLGLDEACWTIKNLLTAASQLPVRDREPLLRAIASL
jgi:hypothetical protein